MKLSPYLSTSRHGIYYFRWPLPKLQGHPTRTIRLSLRTRCPDRAGVLARHLACCGQATREDRTLAALRQEEIREKVQVYFNAQLEQYIDWLDRRGLSMNALADAREEMLNHESFMDINSASLIELPSFRFKRKMNVSNADWEDSQPRIATELRKGRRDMLRRVLEAAERLDHYSFEKPATQSLPLPVLASVTLGQGIDDFMEEHSVQWPMKTAKQFRAYLEVLLEHFGSNCLLADISKQDASEIKKVLQALPVNRNIKLALRDLSLSEIIKSTGHKTISPKTINSHIDAFRRFFDWAERHGYAPQKLFDRMKVPKAKDAKTERKPFSQDQTRLILTELTENPSGFVHKESHKWASLLGLFTGARLNEICQLEIVDIQQEGDILFLNITDEGDNNKRVKAKASRRRVPLHSVLIQLGFLEFVQSRVSNQRLFPDYSYSANSGYGRNLGRWYNESFLPNLKIKEQGLVFHSLRHTMVTRLGQAGVPEPIYQSIVGHTREGVTQEVYLREGFTLKQLSAAIEQFHVRLLLAL